MRERTVATVIIWIAAVAGITQIVDSLTDTVALSILVGLMMLCVTVVTIAMWTTGEQSRKSEQRTAEQSKPKRRDPEREARVRRLLDTLDEEDLQALESYEVGEDGERVSVEELLRRR